MSHQTKELLAAAARDGQADGHWKADGVDRLYFHNPADVNSAGYVEVARVPEVVEADAPLDVQYVKIEIWVAPKLGAEVVALVTGASQALEERLRYEIRRELAAEMEATALAKAEEEAREAEKAPAEKAEKTEKGAMSDPIQVRVPVERTRQDAADALRAAELKELIAAQADDED